MQFTQPSDLPYTQNCTVLLPTRWHEVFMEWSTIAFNLISFYQRIYSYQESCTHVKLFKPHAISWTRYNFLKCWCIAQFAREFWLWLHGVWGPLRALKACLFDTMIFFIVDWPLNSILYSSFCCRGHCLCKLIYEDWNTLTHWAIHLP